MNGDWERYKIYVLESLKRLIGKMDELEKKTNQLEKRVAELQIKSGVWGLLAGILGVLIDKVKVLRTLNPNILLDVLNFPMFNVYIIK